MNGDQKVLIKTIARALSGKSAHLEPAHVFEGLDWKVVGTRPDGVAHSLFQLLNHMTFWQDWVLNWLAGKKRPSPSGSWGGSDGPQGREEWERAVERFQTGFAALSRRSRDAALLSKRGNTTQLEMLLTAASHNSYHAGQVVALRRLLGAWPPRSGRRTRAA